MRRSYITPTIVLSVICIVVAALLSAVNIFTEAKIKDNVYEKTQIALLEVYSEGGEFVPIDLSEHGLPSEVTEAYRASAGGYVFKMNVIGYKSGLVIMCGVDAEGRITGTRYIESNETNGAEDIIMESGAYNGKDIDNLEIDLVAASTKTSKAYFNAVRAALEASEIISEEEADNEQ